MKSGLMSHYILPSIVIQMRKFLPEFKRSIHQSIHKKHPELSEMSFTKLLLRNEGFTEIQRRFLAFTTSSQDEKVFSEIMKETFGCKEVQSWELYDAFSINQHDAFKEFYILCLLVASLETNDATSVLYLFGKQMFVLISASETSEILLENAKVYARFLGFSETVLRKHAREIGLTGKSKVNAQLFLLYHFSLLSEYGQEVSTHPMASPRMPPRARLPPQQSKNKCKAKCQGGWCSVF